MLPKINRLRAKKDFEQVFREGKNFREDFLFLKLNKNNLEVSRFGFVVGRKITKKAVLRNKIKRQLRELLRKKLPQLKTGFDGVWVALGGAENENSKKAGEVIDKILKKAKLWIR